MPSPLPPELIEAILLFLPPTSLTSPDLPDRQADLARCCRVSRAFHGAAFPVLWSHLALKDTKLRDGLAKHAHHVRALRFNASRNLPWSVFVELQPSMRRLEWLELDGISSHEALALTDLYLPHLRQLIVAGVLCEGGPPPGFPRLRSLTLNHVFVERRVLASILDPARAPNLRCLSLGFTHDQSGRPFSPTLSPSFLEQLDMLQVRHATGLQGTAADFSLPTPTLFSFDPSFSLPTFDFPHGKTPPPNLYLIAAMDKKYNWMSDTYKARLPRNLDKLAKIINSPGKPIRSIFLPPFLDSSPSGYGFYDDLVHDAAERLIEACQDCGIEVAFYGWAQVQCEPQPSPEFLRYARQLKERMASRGI
ncbi:hypothetical protein JCM10207_006352 [Rhodosporidiobolus poonsookiae]